VPVPRRFDRRPPERDTTRINERIRVPEVRLIDDEGNQIGVLSTPDALAFAQERELDLVEVAPEARPPVCRVLDYSKYKYEQAQKVKQARKHQQQITIREIKFRPKIAQHDYDTKKHHVERFLRHKDKVKVTIMFRGREVTHPERGTAILDRLAEELSELGVVEQRPMQEGRNMTMMMAPSKAVLAGRVEIGEPADGELRHGAHVGDVASKAIDSPALNGVAGDPDEDVEGQAPAEADAPAEAEATGKAEAPAEGEPAAEIEAPPAAEATAAPGAPAEAEPAAEAEVPAKAKAAAKAQPAAVAEPAAEPKAAAKAKSASD
jgi:translation initiation factor IF-3